MMFNAANAPFVPMLRAARIPTAVHVDGLEWQRAKWQGLGARYYRAAERSECAVGRRGGRRLRAASPTTCREAHGRDSVFIPYGAPIGGRRVGPAGRSSASEPDGYHLVVARFEPENHVDVIVAGRLRAARADSRWWSSAAAPYAEEYEAGVRDPCAGDPRVRFLGSVCGPGACSTSCTPTRRPTCTGTRWAAPTRRCCAPWAPVRRSSRGTSSSTAR